MSLRRQTIPAEAPLSNVLPTQTHVQTVPDIERPFELVYDPYSANPEDFIVIPFEYFEHYKKEKRELLRQHGIESTVDAVPIPSTRVAKEQVDLSALNIPDEVTTPVIETVAPEVALHAAVNRLSDQISLMVNPSEPQAAPSPQIHTPRIDLPAELIKTEPRVIKLPEVRKAFSELSKPKKISLAAVAGFLALTAAAVTSTEGTPFSALQVFSMGGGDLNVGAKPAVKFDKLPLGSVELAVKAVVHVPVAGYKYPLVFQRRNEQGLTENGQPKTSISDTVDVVLSPAIDSNGKIKTFLTVSKDGSLIVDRGNVNAVSTFKDYDKLDVDCSTQKVGNRYCVDAAPDKMPVSGKITQEIADKLSNLMMATGSNYPQYYHGTKAKIVLAALDKLGKADCGKQLQKIGDAALAALLKDQYPNEEIATVKGTFNFISPDYNNTFFRDSKIEGFSIERGNATGGTKDSLNLNCKVKTKGA